MIYFLQQRLILEQNKNLKKTILLQIYQKKKQKLVCQYRKIIKKCLDNWLKLTNKMNILISIKKSWKITKNRYKTEDGLEINEAAPKSLLILYLALKYHHHTLHLLHYQVHGKVFILIKARKETISTILKKVY